MPPWHMRSSECSTVSKKSLSPVRMPARQRNSSIDGCGNFGAPRRPPVTWSTILQSAAPGVRGEPRQERCAVLLDLARLFSKQPRHFAQDVLESRPPEFRVFGEITASTRGSDSPAGAKAY